jgi:signal transduction histidine kinase
MSAKKNSRKQLNLWRWLLILFVISVVISMLYNWLSVQVEHRNRLIFAENLLEGDNEKALQIFEKWEQYIHENSSILCEKTDENFKTESLKQAFDSAFLEVYSVYFLFCDANQYLSLADGKTIVNCHDFFQERIRQQGHPTTHKNLYKIHQTPFDFRYLGIVKISDNQELYLEFVSKEKISWLQNTLRENRYSVAYYDQSGLVKQIGTFFFPLKLFTPDKSNKTFSEYERYDHLLVFTDDLEGEQLVIVSRRIPRIQNQFSTFSFVFILNLCLGLLFLPVWKRASRRLFKSFTQRLQATVLAIVLVVFLVTGATSVIYVQRLNSQKNQKVLREKTYSLLQLMEQTFGEYTPEEILEHSELQKGLIEFSNVFFTDIFFYDETGHIIAKSSIEGAFQNSSRNEMDLQAFHQLSREYKNFYVQRETLNDQTFYSSYIPFRNFRNEIVGYLNLPHFAQRAELRQEIIAFVVAYINMFVVLIILAFALVFLIIKRLTKPLVDSERQIAWNEMAKQIAHEIKNPLTPMKLSVQQIQKAWNDKKDDFDNRMKNFSAVMVEQIDTLSTIASEFANFAQQPNTELTEINLKNCLKKSVLLMNTDNIIQFETTESIENTAVLADEKQLSRALINILKNAIQASSKLENPRVRVSLSASESGVIIAIQNNGKAIPSEIRDRIFEPNFTTKTSGTGLGLAISKNIIERFGGTISFETGEIGTVFYIQLPIINKK